MNPLGLPVLVFSSRHDNVLRDTVEALAADRWARVHAIVRTDGELAGHPLRQLSSMEQVPSDAADDECLLALERVAKREGTRALLPIRNRDVAMVSRQRQSMLALHPVPVPDPDLLPNLVDKWKFSQLAQQVGLETPKAVDIERGIDADSVEQVLRYPLLIKPRRQEAGKGIQMLKDGNALRTALATPPAPSGAILQEFMTGQDVAMTLLADHGQVSAVILKRRWFTPNRLKPYQPYCDFEFFHDPWVEGLGRQFVEATKFSGIADFDLRVDFAGRKARFLECDPRMMGSVSPNRLFGVNVPRLLVEMATGMSEGRDCIQNSAGHFLSMKSIAPWIRSGHWRRPRCGPIQTNWKSVISDPLSRIISPSKSPL